MSKKDVLLGKSPLHLEHKEVTGGYTTLDGEEYYMIDHFDRMRPFFMTIVSSADHWLFLSSNGALSAGRRNPDNALFPYYTDDKITDSARLTGSKAVIRAKIGEDEFLWEPFNVQYRGIYPTNSRLYKNREGNRIIFEKKNDQLRLTYRYGWMFSEKYGIVKRAWIINDTDTPIEINMLDGIANILPYGVDSNLQNLRSTLVDAYKRNELDPETGLAMYSLSSMVVDKAEPSEALRATTVWSTGVKVDNHLLSSLQVEPFKRGNDVRQEDDIKAEKGAYFIQFAETVPANGRLEWAITADVSQSHSDIELLRSELRDAEKLHSSLLKDIESDRETLRRKVGLSDGIQLTKDRLSTGRHFSNVLFNIMRGGAFEDQYEIETKDFVAHIKRTNREQFDEFKGMLAQLPAHMSYHQLRYFITASGKQSLMRYYFEYLPLSFSRRHGDPSRPWNYFSIETKTSSGEKSRRFEGNWRDIFQNWEALAFSYPEFTIGMITKFVNASTVDGYNPYRITSEGIDWEVIEPDDPWSYIGYWGDHQVIYLLKLLELSLKAHPKRLRGLLNEKMFTYANVPYRIKGYDAILSDPKDTIDFDHDLERKVKSLTKRIGADGKMIHDRSGNLLQTNLVEKLLVMTLTKLYNFIPEAGIWLNTQRPEWNDANNALVGNGVSVVTLCYLRRCLDFFKELFSDLEVDAFEVNKPVSDLMDAIERTMMRHSDSLTKNLSDEERRQMMDDFGIAGEHYRTTAYAGFTGDTRNLTISRMLEFFKLAQSFLERTIELNKREDGLYHSYNLVHLSERKAGMSHLYEMLEGQVAALSARSLSPEEALSVLDGLKASAMYRPDQYSYMLYPDRALLPFLKKNKIEPEWVKHSRLVESLLSRGDDSIIEKDHLGNLHFNGDFHQEKDVLDAIDSLEDPALHALGQQEKHILMDAFEKVFDHTSFTGRSGTFYGYEGLGSIYWHMVSKLLLAVQENIQWAIDANADEVVVGKLIEHYYEIRAGVGVNKSPALYGAFPTDVYSHTPKNAGAQQPGMTGQVKEDVINRWSEMGIDIEDGRLIFDPFILRRSEFLSESATFAYYNRNGEEQKLEVGKDALAFTFCQVPIIYQLGKKHQAVVKHTDGSEKTYDGGQIGLIDSKDIFQRTGGVASIKVEVVNVLD